MADEPGTETPLTQEQKAQAAIFAIMGGADLTFEAMTLANEYTDGVTDRVARALKLRRDAEEAPGTLNT